MAVQELVDLATGRVFRRSDNDEWLSALNVGDDYEVLFEGEWDQGDKQLDKIGDYVAIGVSIAGGSTVMIRTESSADDTIFFVGGFITGSDNVSQTSYPCYITFNQSTGVATLRKMYRIYHGTGGSSGTTGHILSGIRTYITKVVGLIRRKD